MKTNNEDQDQKDVSKKKNRGSVTFALILIALGTIFLLNNYGFTYIDIGKLWPLLLILLGGGILFDYYKKR